MLVKNRGFRKGHRGRAVHQVPLAGQGSTRWLHKTGLHFDRDNTRVLLHTARGHCHRDVKQGHQSAAMGNRERIEMLGLGCVGQLGQAAVKHLQLKAEVVDERDLNTRTKAHSCR